MKKDQRVKKQDRGKYPEDFGDWLIDITILVVALVVILVLVLVLFTSVGYTQTIQTCDFQRPIAQPIGLKLDAGYWDNADPSPYFCVVRWLSTGQETWYTTLDDNVIAHTTKTLITGVVIIPPDTMRAYAVGISGTSYYYHEPVRVLGDTISFSLLDEGVRMQDSYWLPIPEIHYVVPLKAIRPRGNS